MRYIFQIEVEESLEDSDESYTPFTEDEIQRHIISTLADEYIQVHSIHLLAASVVKEN
jgi:hypothetical protein